MIPVIDAECASSRNLFFTEVSYKKISSNEGARSQQGCYLNEREGQRLLGQDRQLRRTIYLMDLESSAYLR